MSTTTDTEEIKAALEACDAVRTVARSDDYDQDIGTWQFQVWIEYGTETTEPLEEILAEYDLRIWNADFRSPEVTLARREGFGYGNDIERSEHVTSIDDCVTQLSEVRRTETFIHPDRPRLRVRVEIEYGEQSPAALSRVFAQQGLAIYSVNFRRGTVTVVPAGELTYGGAGE